MIADARDTPVPSGLRFVHGDMRDADRILDGPFGAAVSLGNTLPFLTERLVS